MQRRSYQTEEFFHSLSRLDVYGKFGVRRRIEDADALWQASRTLLKWARAKLSTNVEGSDIWRFNRARCGESVAVDLLTAALVARCKELANVTGGAFDPSVAPLVDLWGFSPRAFNHEPPVGMPYDRLGQNGGWAPPEVRYVEAFRRLVGMEGVVVEGGDGEGWHLRKLVEPVEVDGVVYQAQIDLGGVAKGLFADWMAREMRRASFEYGMYSSASSMALLKNGGDDAPHGGADHRFRLGITTPCAGMARHFMQVYISNRCVSTSGDYGRYHRMDSEVVSHEIDGRTGCPAGYVVERGRLVKNASADSHICSLTLIGPSALDCDGLSTALYVMGARRAVEFFNAELLPTGHDMVMVLEETGEDRYRVVTSLCEGSYRVLDRRFEVVSSIVPGAT